MSAGFGLGLQLKARDFLLGAFFLSVSFPYEFEFFMQFLCFFAMNYIICAT